jgi:Aspartyl protease
LTRLLAALPLSVALSACLTVTGGQAPLVLKGDAVLVEATINGMGPVTLLLDEACPDLVLTPEAEDRLGLVRDTPVSTEGVGGVQLSYLATAKSVEVGDARVYNLPVTARELQRTGIDGILGKSFLKAFRVTVDRPAKRAVFALP